MFAWVCIFVYACVHLHTRTQAYTYERILCICGSTHLLTPLVSAVPMYVGGQTYILPITLHHISACVVPLILLLFAVRGRRPLWLRQALHVKTLHSIKGPLQQQRAHSDETQQQLQAPGPGLKIVVKLSALGAQWTDAETSGLGPLFPSPAPSLWPLCCGNERSFIPSCVYPDVGCSP